MSLIEKLELLGQKKSIKQYQSVNHMMSLLDQGDELLAQALKASEELVCLVEPEDED